jgi:hypothetical protein
MIGRKVVLYIITTDRIDNDLNILYLKEKTKIFLPKDIRSRAMCNVSKEHVLKVAAVSHRQWAQRAVPMKPRCIGAERLRTRMPINQSINHRRQYAFTSSNNYI